jgi:acyl-CoA reductase-like NAD-dependent aldehyde dehydrogenase
MSKRSRAQSAVNLTMTVNGEAMHASKTYGVINPATARVFASAPMASREQVSEAVAAASAAFAGWSATPVEQRREQLRKLGSVLLDHTDELARLLTQEQGKPLRDSIAEVQASADWITALTGIELRSEVLVDTGSVRVEMHRRPIGVVAAIAPWNAPLVIAATAAATVLVTGNTLVFKPSPYTPLTTLRFGELFRRRHGGGAAGGKSQRPQDRFHRIARYRQEDHAQRFRYAQAPDAGARGQ